ncbi:unnamed protein product [Boreogadus saida]
MMACGGVGAGFRRGGGGVSRLFILAESVAARDERSHSSCGGEAAAKGSAPRHHLPLGLERPAPHNRVDLACGELRDVTERSAEMATAIGGAVAAVSSLWDCIIPPSCQCHRLVMSPYWEEWSLELG